MDNNQDSILGWVGCGRNRLFKIQGKYSDACRVKWYNCNGILKAVMSLCPAWFHLRYYKQLIECVGFQPNHETNIKTSIFLFFN